MKCSFHFFTIWFCIYSAIFLQVKTSEIEHDIMIFQAIDSSFFPLWLNWWAIASNLNVIPHSWPLFLACFGGAELEKKILSFHSEGCSHKIGKEIYVKHVYLAKWLSVTKAMEKGKNLLVVDLDSVMIR